MIDDARFPLAARRGCGFRHNVVNRGGVRLDRSRARHATQGSEPYPFRDGRFTFTQIGRVVDGNPVRPAVYDLTLPRVVERYDWDFLLADVLPYVAFRPVGKREDSHRFPLRDFTVVKVPEFGSLVARIPLTECVAE